MRNIGNCGRSGRPVAQRRNWRERRASMKNIEGKVGQLKTF